MKQELNGIYAAAVTPFNEDGSPSIGELVLHLRSLKERGCHGALLAGTTGEGPSLSAEERIALFEAIGQADTGMRLLAGTGAASLEDVVKMTRGAFEAGMDAAVIIPPFFFKNADDEGLFRFYEAVIQRAVPSDGQVLLYHNPGTAPVGVSMELIARLLDRFPDQVTGIKDSSGDRDHTMTLLKRFPAFKVFVGFDPLLSEALAAGGAGSITLVGNAYPDRLRAVYDLYQQGQPTAEAQTGVTEARHQFEGMVNAATIKYVLKAYGVITSDAVRPPLRPLNEEQVRTIRARFQLDEEPVPTSPGSSD